MLLGSMSFDVMRFSTAITTPASVCTPIAVEPSYAHTITSQLTFLQSDSPPGITPSTDAP